MARAMWAALRDGGVAPGEVGHVNAHGTGTVLNDRLESAAIRRVFGAHAAALKVSSLKSMIGHLMAASGAVEFVAATLTVHTGCVPPTINFRTRDASCPLDYVTDGAVTVAPSVVLSNSFGFGGANACLALGPCAAEDRRPMAAP
jgi:3-oxoacyl-(acyl-carrier-protein) synthase